MKILSLQTLLTDSKVIYTEWIIHNTEQVCTTLRAEPDPWGDAKTGKILVTCVFKQLLLGGSLYNIHP